MVHASLFSGIGGPEVAAAMLGWDNAFHCEINPFGRKVLEYWFPESTSYEDITKVDFKEWRGRIDVLTGGFPCQPFSFAGLRKGREDERYLWPEMLRAIDEIRPTWVIGENVVGLASMVEGGVLTDMGCEKTLFEEGNGLHGYELEQTFTIERICSDLEHLGYSVQPMLIPAAAIGAPHRRDRIFILSHRDTESGRDSHKDRAKHAIENTHRPGAVRAAGADESASGESRISEWDKVQHFRKSNNVRSEDGETASVTELLRLQHHLDGRGEKEMLGEKGEGGENGLSAEIQLAPAESGGGAFTNTTSEGYIRGAAQIERGRLEGSTNRPLHGNTSRPCEGIASADSNRTGREEPQQPGRREDSTEGGAGLHDRVERSCGNGGAPNTFGTNMQPGERWADFPTVSPVHRGNDGLPFPLDNLTIPASKWRTESLKAYGNAIVPQVMYRIFQAIEQVEYEQEFTKATE